MLLEAVERGTSHAIRIPSRPVDSSFSSAHLLRFNTFQNTTFLNIVSSALLCDIQGCRVHVQSEWMRIIEVLLYIQITYKSYLKSKWALDQFFLKTLTEVVYYAEPAEAWTERKRQWILVLVSVVWWTLWYGLCKFFLVLLMFSVAPAEPNLCLIYHTTCNGMPN